MRERPILMSAPMVRACLREVGPKTQTRRVAKAFLGKPDLDEILRRFPEQQGCPYGVPGDRLWVREAWRTLHKWDTLAPRNLADDTGKITYEADPENRNPLWAFGKLRPGMFMPRWASRLTLEITEVRVERLNDCSEADALAEGVVWSEQWQGFVVPGVEHPNKDFPVLSRATAREMYAALWDTINGSGARLGNPWVWAVSFKRVEA